MAELSHARSFLDGSANILGFDPDFLVLIQEFPDTTSGNQFDSCDALIRWIRNTATSPLSYAETTFNRAFQNYKLYQGFADQADAELVVAQAEDSFNDLAREEMSIALQTSDAQKMQVYPRSNNLFTDPESTLIRGGEARPNNAAVNYIIKM